MGFFKETGSTTPSKTIARLQQVIWILIYAGLLTLVLGLSVQRIDEAMGWTLVVSGAMVAALGFVLIYVRSRLTSDE